MTEYENGESRDTIFLYPDEIGYVRLVETMGDQYTPAEDARMSTGKGRLGPEKDNALQDRLVRDQHTSPFEGTLAKFEICVPLFVLRELDRHRTLDKISEDDPHEFVSPGEDVRKWFARNEMSGRYIQLPDLYYHPAEVRGQSRTNVQGGAEDAPLVSPEVAGEFLERGLKLSKDARELYSWAVERGVEKGLARIYNTQNQYTKIRMTGSIKNWLDFLNLRLPKGVQWECRRVAEAIQNFLWDEFPDVVSTWRRRVYDTVRISSDELDVILWSINVGLNELVLTEDSKKQLEAIKKKLVEKLEERWDT